MRRATVKRSPVPSELRKEGIVDTRRSERRDYIRNLGPGIVASVRTSHMFPEAVRTPSSPKLLNRDSITACWGH